MEDRFGQHGWKEFNRNRKDILSELDKILEQTENRPIQVAHGLGVEAYLRKWLSEFLPKKYGVTSGYIIPNLYGNNFKLYHYDIIIYNQLEAPILWTEGNFDQSEQGKYRAIPAKHVVAVYEVKSRLTKSNITDALNKLNQTSDFSSQLNPFYSSGIIFIDLKENDNNNESIIKELIKGKDILGFSGGLILRYEGDPTATGLIRLFDIQPENNFDINLYKPIAKPIDSLNIYLTEEGALTIAEKGAGVKLVATSTNNLSFSKTYGIYFNEGTKSIHIKWSRNNFSDFCIELISSLEGLVYNDKNRPSFGQVFDNLEMKKAPRQSKVKEEGKPFLVLTLYEGGELGNKLTIDNDTLTFVVSIENQGALPVTLSDDLFKSKFELPAGETAIKTVSLELQTDKTDKTFADLIKQDGVEHLYRVVYYADEIKKDFLSIEANIRIYKNEVTISDL
ncbi:hypothetical protein E6C50_01910 [Flavobacterium supellecticarium]|uniref:DUF6602 domain-containing protein n=1 Tax=Flavobacterium supellecticarium TaxID=2565924 RepID=A0A4V3W8X3_9FLAO|nr:DUF6602 domain-containing protein [Flavobacterium supellecticarium]THF52986.1 hypothetical protein E6C50_01910 [Flavobacterium supellecticarium]